MLQQQKHTALLVLSCSPSTVSRAQLQLDMKGRAGTGQAYEISPLLLILCQITFAFGDFLSLLYFAVIITFNRSLLNVPS